MAPAKFLLAATWILLQSLASAQLEARSETKLEIRQVFPPLDPPLLSLEGAASSGSGVKLTTRVLSGTLTLLPGVTYRVTTQVFAQGWSAAPGTGGAQADVLGALDFNGGAPTILASSTGSAFGCLTELGASGSQVCFQPSVGRFFDIALPFGTSSFASMQDLAYGVGLAFGSCELGASLAQASLDVSARVLASSSYSWPQTPPGLWSTSSATTHVDFVVTQATMMTLRGAMESALQGATQAFPLTPESGRRFLDAPASAWFGAPFALGFDLQQTGSALFAEISSLPVGVVRAGQFHIFVGSRYLGLFLEGSRVDFLHLTGSAVPQFRVIAEGPAIDPTRPFPLKLAFDSPRASFTMQPLHYQRAR